MIRKHKIIWCNKGWQPVFFGFCPSKKAWKKELKERGTNDPYPTSSGAVTFFDGDGGVAAVVTFSDEFYDMEKAACVGLIAHEATHIFQAVRNAMGEAEPSNEFEAYSIQAITQELIYAIQERTDWAL